MANMNRRDFIKTAGVGATGAAVGAAALGAGTALAEEAASGTEQLLAEILPASWDYETDVLILGTGAAGINAGIAAAQAGVETLIIEAAPEQFKGGNTGVAGGGFVQTYEADIYLNYLERCCFGCTEDKYLEAHVEAMSHICEWLDSLGITYTMDQHNYGHWLASGDAPEVVSSIAGLTESGVDHYSLVYEDGTTVANGADVMKEFTDVLDTLPATIMYETRGVQLYQNPVTKEVLGLRATDKDGNDVNIKARKGIILACGGFENNPEMIDAHIRPGARIYPAGTPYNRGDGQLMAQEIGAKMWHMDGIEWQCYGIRPFASVESDLDMAADMVISSHWQLDTHLVIVNRYGHRFFPEDRSMSHTKQFDGLDFVGYADQMDQLDDYKGRWAYVIFDQARMDELADQDGAGEICPEAFVGPTGSVGAMGWIGVHELYKWDLEQALETGLLVKADTLDELAEKAGIPYADNLKATIDNWNTYCDEGVDPEFARDVEPELRIDTPPYYAVTVYPAFINTQGGPVHDNLTCRVIDNRGNEIPRLYATGECGSVYSLMYHGSGNIAEAIITGKNAAQDAAKLENWDA